MNPDFRLQMARQIDRQRLAPVWPRWVRQGSVVVWSLLVGGLLLVGPAPSVARTSCRIRLATALW